MRFGGIEYRAAVAVAAMVVVVGLAVPIVSASGANSTVDGAVASNSFTGDSIVGSAPPPVDDAPVVASPAPVPTAFDAVASPPASNVAAPDPERTTTIAASSASTASSATTGRPTATAPAQPLAAQPAPIDSPSVGSGCPAAISGTTPGAPSRTSPLGVVGTSSADMQTFATAYNAIRVANCLPPVPFANFRYDSCMEDRLFWMAEDPSTDPLSAWGHVGSVRSDGVPSVGCDGNLAGGTNSDGSVVAQKWWDSSSHRSSLYKPTYTASTAAVCIMFAMSHGGVPNEPLSFTRAAARWDTC